ncbi:DUF1573 domain-containing protein [Fimbriimonas ginsengisoli]|uniref:DUF1573 domain-containing protein n=1 Tax=Fimbriimonas ginsengisoli Gsoil 348 TaxID=661478 RepID=A0A068NKZ8_FIMGI|nr:DUF1573 domain-containing protein [Fimbriimonas ginsengisoli]AIE84263.1 hypothetical protein OP10G_0895 [Fimbriimonas ginsengisoli Gsoil 348]
MFAPLLIVLAAAAKPGPALPPLTSANFQDTVLLVEQSMEQGNFALAQKQATMLPKRRFTISFDDRKLPATLRPTYRTLLAQAVRGWRDVEAVVKTGPADLRIAFEPALAVDAETGASANVVTFFSSTPGEPRVEAVIGLHRGKPVRDTSAGDFFNDARYAIGAYLGLAKLSAPGFIMGSSTRSDNLPDITSRETVAAAATLRLSDRLREAIAAKKKVGLSGRSDAFIDPVRFKGDGVQGENLELPIQVSNRGKGLLAVQAAGDCGCLVPEKTDPIAPGESTIVRVILNTHELAGELERHITLFTNDPNNPIVTIPVQVSVVSRYRFLTPNGNAVAVDEGGSVSDLYFTYPDGEGNELKITNARTIGIEGSSVEIEPWSGTLPDPEFKEGPKLRRGYHLKVHIPGKLPPGRAPLNIALVTASPDYPVVYHSIFVQRGIVAQPEELFLGETNHERRTSTVVLTRPGRPFQVLSARSTLSTFTVKVLPGDHPDEVKLQIAYDGKAPAGPIEGEVVVTTNDPKQSVVHVPIVGSTR